MTDPLERVTRLLQDAANAGDVDALPAGRDVAIARLADAIRGRARLKRRKRAIYTLSIAAGVMLVVGGAIGMARRTTTAPTTASDLGRVLDPSGGVTVVRDGRSETLGQGSRVAEGTELRTSASSEAHLDFDSGTRVTLGGAARVRLVEQSQRKRFSLEAGSFFAKVAKLGADERFVVTTPDAEVEVRGTAFRVTIVPPNAACAGGSPTRLDVSEGVVVIRHAGVEQRVAAGERWPVCDEASAPKPASAPAGTATVKSTATAAAPHAAAPANTSASQEASSRLAQQNDLYDQAMRQKHSGDAPGAVATLDRLLASYPGGPLAEGAAAERMRLLASSDPARASAAARDYLQRHPRGFARAEAEAIVSGRP